MQANHFPRRRAGRGPPSDPPSWSTAGASPTNQGDTWGVCKVPAQSPSKVLKTPCPASGALSSRGSKERLGSEECTRRPVKERSVARGEGGSLRLFSSLLFGVQNWWQASSGFLRKTEEGQFPSLNQSALCQVSERKFGWKTSTKWKHTNQHTNSRSIFQEIRNQENHPVRGLQ